ncbi:restriction endonuclease subunit S [Faecalibacterium sp. OM04-11BH]|uniref:restriction endonuclease subunit S n=1 Tax=Faecalibacterium sp. OM04-11BH TaxID=2292357 RepID=UPI000E51276A|nr:restriction endonuclease subunit S [Faecalibacterium sp. OM04-11BH]RHV53827.1 restriction endonuclease subunit S [Faecalibacterium sp. OM04-11BH]
MAKLGDICTVVSGSTPKTGVAEYWDGTVKWITPAELNEDSFYITDSVRHITEYGKEKTGLSYLPKGTVILSSRAPIGKTAIAGCEMCCNQGFKNLICSDAIYNEYLYFFLKSKTDYLNSLGRGATFKEISKSIVEKIEIPLPNIEKQHQIVKELKATRNLIAHRKQQLTKLDELIKARFVEMFGDCRLNPKGWVTKNLDQVADVGSSKRVFVEELQSEGIPFYRGTEVGALAEGKSIRPELFITEGHYKQLCEATGKPQKGDLLMPSICPDGRIWVVDTDAPFYFKDGRVLWVHLTSQNYNPVFLLYTLKDRIMTDYESIASGTTFAELKIFALKKCRIFDVPLSLQNQFAAFVAEVDKSKLFAELFVQSTCILAENRSK